MKTPKLKLLKLSLAISACFSLNCLAADDDPLGRDALFGDDIKPTASSKAASGDGVKGFVQFEGAWTTSSPDHWSKLRTRADLNSNGKLGEGLKWKMGVRVDYDFVYGINDFYNSAVEQNQRFDVTLRENYLDYSAGNWDFRFGRQHVVWGEMVGLFFADVVSARDQREFILPEFDQMRIPQWAARAEYFSDDTHAELLWIPVASYDNIGRPGAEYFPYQPVPSGANVQYLPEQRPENNAQNMNYGIRLSTLKNGWDVSGFYYRSSDTTPTFYREIVLGPTPTFIYQARHDRIHQFGGTLAKDFGDIVLKAEGVYTRDRQFAVLNMTDPDGLAKQNTLDWAVGLDFTLPAESRLNIQLFQRQHFDHNPDLIADRLENGYSLFASTKLTNNWEAQATFISSLNRSDWLFRPRATWSIQRNWRLLLGADVFHGPSLGLFGRFDQRDRVYSEIRYSF